ncbi:MAG: hypothetical protein CEE38_13530 [Planctomycetes bacterium B3_Pla]|nr:MAG: hypothetical protein CEE38_13530 [Planctomycetes bacterium B3_Pla]
MNRDKKKKISSIDLMIAAKASLLCGVLVLGSFLFLRNIFLFSISFLLMSLAAPLLAILSHATTLSLKNSEEKRSSVVRICVLTVPLLVGILYVIGYSIPYLYTLRAITAGNYKFYKSCVEFATSHSEQEDITVSWFGHYRKGRAIFPGADSNEVNVREHFSEDEISEMLLLSKQMKKFGCIRFRRSGDIVLFYRHRNRILPTRPGVVFSINGRNPNDVDSGIVNEHKPFLKINNEWYVSRQLVYGGLRGDIKMSLPKSLIDHSLRTITKGDILLFFFPVLGGFRGYRGTA